MSTRPPPYPARLLGDAPAILSPERFMRYMQAANGDVCHAIELYEINIQVSEGVFGFFISSKSPSETACTPP